MSDGKIEIIYDKQCPACSKYCDLVKSSSHPKQVRLVDARDESDLMTKITSLGLDIDEGMVVVVDGELHFGADAIHALAITSSRGGLFNLANSVLFKSRRISRVLYPLLRCMRNFLLKILGVGRINNLNIRGKDRF